MPRIALANARAPFVERLRTGWRYPLRGSALASCVALGLANLLSLLPGLVGLLVILLVRVATWRYAAESLLHTARGYAEPPELGLDEGGSAGWTLTVVHLLVGALYVACAEHHPAALWLLVPAVTLLLPAIDLSLAFDGSPALALNPFTWWRIAHGTGATYLAAAAIELASTAAIALAAFALGRLPSLLTAPLYACAYVYCAVLAFHLLGVLVQRRHEDFGVAQEAERLADAHGQNDDERLRDEAAHLAASDPTAALRLLAARLQQRAAPAFLHQAYRDLLRRQNLRADLLVHGQIWIAALLANGEAKRALGLVQECSELDPSFIPDDPGNAGPLAELAARLGMTRLAVHLCRGFVATWPRSEQVPHYAMLGARLLAGPLERPAEALVLLGRAASHWPEHPDLLALTHQLQAPTNPA